jgi:hypothetical protein
MAWKLHVLNWRRSVPQLCDDPLAAVEKTRQILATRLAGELLGDTNARLPSEFSLPGACGLTTQLRTLRKAGADRLIPHHVALYGL